MARNDGILYTGQTSASRRAYKIEQAKQAKAKQQSLIAPNEKVIMEFIDKELENTTRQLLELVNPATPEADVKSLIVSLNLYKQSMLAVKQRVFNVLRRSLIDKELIDE